MKNIFIIKIFDAEFIYNFNKKIFLEIKNFFIILESILFYKYF
jgi:hypothetical protein